MHFSQNARILAFWTLRSRRLHRKSLSTFSLVPLYFHHVPSLWSWLPSSHRFPMRSMSGPHNDCLQEFRSMFFVKKIFVQETAGEDAGEHARRTSLAGQAVEVVLGLAWISLRLAAGAPSAEGSGRVGRIRKDSRSAEEARSAFDNDGPLLPHQEVGKAKMVGSRFLPLLPLPAFRYVADCN